MKLRMAIAIVLLAIAPLAKGDPAEARLQLLGLPHADVARLIGSWEVEEMKPISMIYEFQLATMAMHGRSDSGKSTFELTMDADYRTAGANAVWVIGTMPRPIPEDSAIDASSPSIMGIEFTTNDRVTLTVSAQESFTLVRVH